MVVFGHSRCIRAKVVVFGERWLFSSKSGCIQAKWLCSGKMVVFGEEWLYSGKKCCNQAKGVVFKEKLVVISQKWLYLDKVVVFGQSGCIWSN